MNQKNHTPEGLRDRYGKESDTKRWMERGFEQLFRSYGYDLIETPMIEFQEVFSKEIGSLEEARLFRLFDRDGRLLALRPDFTPAVARCASMYFTEEDEILRLYYHGSVFRNHSGYQGRLRESTQMGVECFNDDSVLADAEVLAITASVLKESKLSDFQISLGHVGYFQALTEEAGLDEESIDRLRKLLIVQNVLGAQELIGQFKLRKDLENALLALPSLSGGIESVCRAKAITTHTKAKQACDRLLEIHNLLEAFGVSDCIAYDLGMLTEYHYYSGIIFRAFTYGVGDAVIKGGRYDHLSEYFGKCSAAVGFAIETDTLYNALLRQQIVLPISYEKTMILYPEVLEKLAIRFAQENRNEGLDIACVRFRAGKELDDYRKYGQQNRFGGIVYIKSESEAYAINLETGEVSVIQMPLFDESNWKEE